MKKKMFFSILLSLVLVMSLLPGMSLTAHAAASYNIMIDSTLVTASVNNQPVTSAEVGTAVTLTANPAAGSRLDSISGTYKVQPIEILNPSNVKKTYFQASTTDNWNLTSGYGDKVTVTVVPNPDWTDLIISNAEINISPKRNFDIEKLSVNSGSITYNPNKRVITVSSVNNAKFELSGFGDNATGCSVSQVKLWGSGYYADKTLTINATSDPNVFTFTMPSNAKGDVSITTKFVSAHVHDFSYTADGATITAACGADGCPLTGEMSWTISAPDKLGWDGDPKEASLSGVCPSPAPAGLATAPTGIRYYKVVDGQNTLIDGAPIAAGDYVAAFDWGGKTASVAFTIIPARISQCGEGLEWAYEDKTLTVSYSGSGSGRMYNYSTSPDALPQWYEHMSEMETVVLAQGVSGIGSCAFSGCSNLSAVTFEGDSQLSSIGHHAFSGCESLPSVTVPANVTELPDYCFSGCTNLTDVTVLGTLTGCAGTAFENCTGLERIYCNKDTWNKLKNNLSGTPLASDQSPWYLEVKASPAAGGTVTGGGAYAKKTPALSAAVTAAPATDYVFTYWTDSSGAAIVSSDAAYTFDFDPVHGIPQTLYANFGKTTGSCGSSLTWTVSDEDSDGVLETLAISGSGAMSNYSYGYIAAPWEPHMYNIQAVIIGKDVTSIGDAAFFHFENLSSLTFEEGSGLQTIGGSAFDKCQKLTELTLPDTVTRIGMGAFNECTGLASVPIGDNVQYIYSVAFQKCENLTHIDCTKDKWDNFIKGQVEDSSSKPFDQTPFNPTGSNGGGWYVGVSSADPVACGTVTGGGAYAKDLPITLTADPAPGYGAYWTNADGEVVKDGDGRIVGSEYTFTPEDDVTLTAHFHLHSFTYSADGDTITATCSADNCPLDDGTEAHNHTITLTVDAPTLTYVGQTGEGISAAAPLDGLDDFNAATGNNVAVTDITYVGRDGTEYAESTTAPTEAGDYTATITLSGVSTGAGATGDLTISVDYSIVPSYPLLIAGRQVTAAYLSDKGYDQANPDKWTWQFTPAVTGDTPTPDTLTLNGLNMEDMEAEGTALQYTADTEWKIVLASGSVNMISWGGSAIDAAGSVSVTGAGTLFAISDHAAAVKAGSLTVGSGAAFGAESFAETEDCIVLSDTGKLTIAEDAEMFLVMSEEGVAFSGTVDYFVDGVGYDSQGQSYDIPVSGKPEGGASLSQEQYIEILFPKPYDLAIGGVLVTAGNLSGEGWSFTPAGNNTPATLTLSGFELSYDGSDEVSDNQETYHGGGINYFDDSTPLTIVLEGTNTVTATGSHLDPPNDGPEMSIYMDGIVTSAPLTITGTGSLEASGYYGLLALGGGDITVKSGAKLTAAAANDSQTLTGVGGGIHVGGDEYALIIEDGASVTAGSAEGAIGGKVKNAMVGLGWTDAAGTEGKSLIPASGEGQTLSGDYKKVQFPASYTVTYDLNGAAGTAPTDTAAYAPGGEVSVKALPDGVTFTGFDFAGWNTKPDGTGTLYLPGDSASGKFAITGDTTLYAVWAHTHGTGSTALTFIAWTDAAARAQKEGDGVTAANTLPIAAGNWALTKNVTVSSTWSVSGAINLCLCEKIVTGPNSGDNTVEVTTGGTLSLYDDSTDGETTFGEITRGRIALTGGAFNLYSGEIDCPVNVNDSSSVFNMRGGSVGETVSIECGAFNLYGGTVISDNGTGVDVGTDGNVDSGTDVVRSFTMSGGCITGSNIGVLLRVGGTFTMSGGSIQNNGTGVSHSGGTMNISGNPVIFANGSDQEEIDVDLMEEKINIIGALENTASIGVRSIEPIEFTSGWADKMTTEGATADPADYFHSNDTSFGVFLTSGGEAELAIPAVEPTVSGVTGLTGDNALTYGYSAGSVSVSASGTDEYTLSYQWYSCASDGSGATAINAANEPTAITAEYAIPTGKSAGTCYYCCDVTATREDNGRQATKRSGVAAVTVNKAEVTAPTIPSKTYNTQTQTADVAASGLYTVTTNAGGTYVGNYDVVLTLTDTDNYKWTDSTEAAKTLTFTITQAAAPDLAAPTLAAVTYDPNQTLESVDLPDRWAWVTKTAVPTVSNNGYAAEYTVPDDTNYDYTDVDGYSAQTHKVTMTVALTVNPADSAAAAVTANTLTCDNTQQQLVSVDASALAGGTMQYVLGTDSVTVPTAGWSEDVPTGTDAGTYYVWYKVVGDDNHSDTDAVCVTVTIAMARPKIVMNRLKLEGVLDFQYYLWVPEDFDETGATMTFSIPNQADQTVAYKDAPVDQATGLHVFDCSVVAYQMADTITATFTFKDGTGTGTVVDTCSVEQYLIALAQDQTSSDETRALVDAMRNYGHYLQPYLKRLHPDTEYTEMGKGSSDVDIDAALAGSKARITPFTPTIDTNRITDLLIRMNINAGSSLVFEFKLQEGVSGTVTAKVGSAAEFTEITADPERDNVYRIEFENIAANNLDLASPFLVKLDGRYVFVTKASPMDYLSKVLEQSVRRDEKLALAALYEYWAAADDYDADQIG